MSSRGTALGRKAYTTGASRFPITSFHPPLPLQWSSSYSFSAPSSSYISITDQGDSYFNFTDTVDKTIDSIRGYMPAIAHWGYNGNARRYWDFTDGGEPDTARIERQIHHYGSALNALPLLHYLRSNTSEIVPGNGGGVSANARHLLRLAFAGSFAPLTNIQPDGFGSAAFHAFPETLGWDGYSGDYGPGFVGMMLGAATYVVEDGSGVSVWGGELQQVQGCSGAYDVVPRDAVRMRVYVAPLGLWVELAAGAIEKVRVLDGRLLVKVAASIGSSAVTLNETVVWIENSGGGNMKPVGLQEKRGGWALPLTGGSAVLKIQ